jgi:hypothetical protein
MIDQTGWDVTHAKENARTDHKNGQIKKLNRYESLRSTEGCAVTRRYANSLDQGNPLDFYLILPSWFFTIMSAAQEKHHAMYHVKDLLEQIFPHHISPCVIGL